MQTQPEDAELTEEQQQLPLKDKLILGNERESMMTSL